MSRFALIPNNLFKRDAKKRWEVLLSAEWMTVTPLRETISLLPRNSILPPIFLHRGQVSGEARIVADKLQQVVESNNGCCREVFILRET